MAKAATAAQPASEEQADSPLLDTLGTIQDLYNIARVVDLQEHIHFLSRPVVGTDEPEHVFERYGPESKKPGTYAANCILARRLAERGVRFIQLYHRGWDQHNKCPEGVKHQ